MFKNNKTQNGEKWDKNYWVAYLLLLPAFLLLVTFSYYPMLKTLINSFSVTDSIGGFIKFAGVSNWQRMFHDIHFWPIIRRTFLYAFLNFVLTFFPAMFFALLSARIEKGSKLYQTLYALPMAIAAATIAIVWHFIFGRTGLFNEIVGTDTAWLAQQDTSIYLVAFLASWGHIAGNYLYLMVGFRNVPEDLIEASRIDGAGWWIRTFRIMIPMASPQIFFVLFTSIITSFKTFTQIKLLTNGGPAGSTTTLMYWLYEKYSLGQISYCACISLVLFLVIFIATRIQFAFEKKMVFYQ